MDKIAIFGAPRSGTTWLSQILNSHPEPDIGNLVPHDFPIVVHDGCREKLYFELMKEDLPTIALYYRLIDAITPDAFPLSHALSKDILNLPVHQDTDQADLEHLNDRLVKILAGLRA
jgi:dTDP-4-amino-4,6-dideoxygalactose transaminase